MATPGDLETARAELLGRLSQWRRVLRLGLVLAGIFVCATIVSWTIALVALRPACEAHAEKRHLVYDGMALSYFSRGNRVSPCRFRNRLTGEPADVVRWRSLDGATFLVEIGVRPDLMSYILGGLGLTGWLFLTPTGRALRRNRTQ